MNTKIAKLESFKLDDHRAQTAAIILQINCSEIIIYDASEGRHRKKFRFRFLGRQLAPSRKS